MQHCIGACPLRLRLCWLELLCCPAWCPSPPCLWWPPPSAALPAAAVDDVRWAELALPLADRLTCVWCRVAAAGWAGCRRVRSAAPRRHRCTGGTAGLERGSLHHPLHMPPLPTRLTTPRHTCHGPADWPPPAHGLRAWRRAPTACPTGGIPVMVFWQAAGIVAVANMSHCHCTSIAAFEQLPSPALTPCMCRMSIFRLSVSSPLVPAAAGSVATASMRAGAAGNGAGGTAPAAAAAAGSAAAAAARTAAASATGVSGGRTTSQAHCTASSGGPLLCPATRSVAAPTTSCPT